MRGRTIAFVAVVSLVLASCGDDDDTEGGADTGADTSAAGDSTTAAAVSTAAPGSTTAAPASTAATPGPTGGSASTIGAGEDCTLDEPLKIGYAADFSDFGGFADVPGSEAAGVQVDLLNEAGGVGGQHGRVRRQGAAGRSVRRPAGRPGAARRRRRRHHRPAVHLQRRAADRHRRRPGAGHLQRLDRPRSWPTRPAARS